MLILQLAPLIFRQTWKDTAIGHTGAQTLQVHTPKVSCDVICNHVYSVEWHQMTHYFPFIFLSIQVQVSADQNEMKCYGPGAKMERNSHLCGLAF